MPRSPSIKALDEQIEKCEKGLTKYEKALFVAKEVKKAELERQERQLALKIGYLAIICGLGPVPDGDLESFFKTFGQKQADTDL